jgi:hypothetical protein
MMNDLLPGDLAKAARMFASGSHERIAPSRHAGQQSPESHLKAVTQLVVSVSKDEALAAAAWLHDIVEDTGVTIGEVERRFGRRVARLVDELTPPPRRGRGGREARLAAERQRLAGISAEAKTIKLADAIDTLRDARRGGSGPAGAFPREARDLVGALRGGDGRLLERLARELQRDAGPPASPAPPGSVSPRPSLSVAPRALRAFERAFSADDIAEPLLSFDDECDGRPAAEAMRRAGVAISGVRTHGVVSGYVDAQAVGEGPCGRFRRDIVPGQIVASDAALGDVIEVLTHYDWCFVTAFGAIAGVVSRRDAQKPAVRMWLFGIITVLELELTDRVGRRWPEDGWASLVAPARLGKARELFDERRRRKEPCGLLDCLQLADKLEILLHDDAALAALGIPTVSAARRIGQQVERLRNSLAHSQRLGEQDWPQVVRLARRIAGFAAIDEDATGRT